MKIIIDYKKCCWRDGKCASCNCGGTCTGCAEICPVQAITREKIIKIDYNKCTACGACVFACEHEALSFVN